MIVPTKEAMINMVHDISLERVRAIRNKGEINEERVLIPSLMAKRAILWQQGEATEYQVEKLQDELLRRFRQLWRLPIEGRQHWFEDGSSISRPDKYIVRIQKYCGFREKMVTYDYYLDVYNRAYPEGITEKYLTYVGPIGLAGSLDEVVAKCGDFVDSTIWEEKECSELFEFVCDRTYSKLKDLKHCNDIMWLFTAMLMKKYTWRDFMQKQFSTDKFARIIKETQRHRECVVYLDAIGTRLNWRDENKLGDACRALGQEIW